jgi:hypothetical protein
MPRLIDRRSGAYLGSFSREECTLLTAILQAQAECGQALQPDAETIERCAAAGVSDRLLAVLQQLLQRHEACTLEWDPDPSVETAAELAPPR